MFPSNTFPCPVAIIATKTDLEDHREVSYVESTHYALRLGVPYVEVSAKSKSSTKIHDFFQDRILKEVRELRLQESYKKYQSLFSFLGDSTAGLRSVISQLVGRTISMNLATGVQIVFVPSQKFAGLWHRIWWSDVNVASQPTSYMYSQPSIVFYAFSVANRYSFDKLSTRWTRINRAMPLLLGTQTHLREYLKLRNSKEPKLTSSDNNNHNANDHELTSPFKKLPDEIIVHIFSFLPHLDEVLFTCRRFAKLAEHPSLTHVSSPIQLPEVSQQEANDLLEKMAGYKYCECSRKTSCSISLDDLFGSILKDQLDEQIFQISSPSTQRKRRNSFAAMAQNFKNLWN